MPGALLRRVGVERRLSDKELVENDAEGPEVDLVPAWCYMATFLIWQVESDEGPEVDLAPIYI